MSALQRQRRTLRVERRRASAAGLTRVQLPSESRRLRCAPALLALAAALAQPGSAFAGPVEQLAQVALHPTDSNVIVLRYLDGGHGLFYSRDAGKSWRLMCLSAISDELTSAGPIAVTGDGQVLLGVFQGLFADDGKGCAWTQNPLVADRWASAFAPHPSDPGVTFVSTARNSPGVKNGVLRRDADGTFSEVGLAEELLIMQVHVAAREDGLRFYERVLDGDAYKLRYSDDDRETFNEIPFSEMGGNLSIAAVDPSNPDRIIAVFDRPAADDDVLVSDDRGATLRKYMSVSQFGGIRFLPSGKIFIAEAGFSTSPASAKGLWVTEGFDEAPAKLADYEVSCMEYMASTDTLFGCQYRTFGKIDQGSGEYTQLFAFTDVVGFVECEGQDIAEACAAKLCVDYCTFGHFARAPVCEAYENHPQHPVCGPCAAQIDEGADVSVCIGAGQGGSAAGSGGAGGAGVGGASPWTAGVAARPSAGADTPRAGSAGGSGRGGGSGCSIAGERGRGSAQPVASGALIGAALSLRRRRRR